MKSPKNNAGFFCVHCKKEVKEHPTSSRNHCTHCLYSLHVDIIPGDRMEKCHGTMEPIGLSWNGKKGEQLVFRCLTCGTESRCKIAEDDNFEKLITLRKKPLHSSIQ